MACQTHRRQRLALQVGQGLQARVVASQASLNRTATGWDGTVTITGNANGWLDIQTTGR